MRAFLAVLIDIDSELRQGIAAFQQNLKEIIERSDASRARITWVRSETVHLTIKFLGDIDDARVDPLRASVEAAVLSHQAIDIPLARLGAFPRDQAPRALWIGPSADWDRHEDAGRSGRLVAAIDEACATFGVERDRHPWRAHLTLARVRDRDRALGRALVSDGVFDRPVPLGALRVDEIALMKSVMQPAGPVHTKLWSVTL